MSDSKKTDALSRTCRRCQACGIPGHLMRARRLCRSGWTGVRTPPRSPLSTHGGILGSMTQKPETTRHARRAVLAVLAVALGVGLAAGPARADQRPTTQTAVTAAAATVGATPSPASVSSRSVNRTVIAFAGAHGFTVHLAPLPRYRGIPAYATTDMRTCQVWVARATSSTVAIDVLRHEYIHVLQCRAGTHFVTAHLEHVADAGAALQGSRRAFYGRFSTDDTLEARRLLKTMQ